MSPWLPVPQISEQLDAVSGLLAPAGRSRLAQLRTLMGQRESVSVGEVLATIFDGPASVEAKQRAFQRLVTDVNKAAAAGTPVRLTVSGAKQRGDARELGFMAARPSALDAKADLAESHGLASVGTRRAQDVTGTNPTVRVLLWATTADQALAGKLWQPLRDALAASADHHFVVEDTSSGVRVGEDREVALRRLMEWSNLVVLAVTPGLLRSDGDDPEQTLWREAHGATLAPVVLKALPRDADQGMLQGRVWAHESVFSRIRAANRTDYANTVADQLAKCAAARDESDCMTELGSDWDALACGDVSQLTETLKHHIGHRGGRRGFRCGDGNPVDDQSADIEDVDAHLLGWATQEDGKSLLALLGDSGIGKTIAAQRLADTLWRRPGAPIAHYFDLRDLTGFAGRVGVPPLAEILSQCIASGWVKEGRELDTAEAREQTKRILADSKAWPTVFIVDGLDEALVHLSQAEGQQFTNQLLRLQPVGQDPIVGGQTKLMLTCRTHYFTSVAEQVGHFRDQSRGQTKEEDYEALNLLPVTREQIADYLSADLGWPTDDVEAFLTGIHDLWDLASRPYLLSELSSILPNLKVRSERGERIVAATVYTELVQNWLTRDKNKHVIDATDKPAMMAYVAHRLWRSGGRSASVENLRRWLADFINAEGLMFQYQGKDPAVLANDLHTATFLVRQDEGSRSTFRFAHSSMGEYFLAAWLIRCLDRDDPGGWGAPAPGQETLEFLRQLLETHPERPRLLQTLAGWRKPYRKGLSETLLALGLCSHAAGDDISLIGIDLSGADLRDAIITGTPEHPINLSAARLRGTRLERSQLEHVQLRGAALDHARIDHAIWNDIACEGVSTDGLDGEGALLRYCALNPSGNEVRLVPRTDVTTQSVCFPARLTLPTGHDGGVLSVAYNGSGDRIATAGSDGTIRVWDPATGEPMQVMTGHRGEVLSVAYNGSGDRIATAGSDGTIRVWNPATGEPMQVMTGHRGEVRSVAYNGSGDRIATAGSDGTVRVWNPATGGPVQVLPGDHGSVLSVAYSRSGDRIATAGSDGTVRVWNAVTGEQLQAMTDHRGSVWSVAYNGSGDQIATAGSDGTVRLWNPATGECAFAACALARGAASWVPGPRPRLLFARGDAWRWLRAQVLDEDGRLISQDPYEWHYPTEGEAGRIT